jgi:hypothetical protein
MEGCLASVVTRRVAVVHNRNHSKANRWGAGAVV